MSLFPFQPWEVALAGRYLRAKRKEGGVALISLISFAGIALAVFGLIAVTSVFNGFRTELLSRMLGFNGHAYVQSGPALLPGSRDGVVRNLRAIPSVTQAVPLIEDYVLAEGAVRPTPAVVRGLTPGDLAANPLIADNLQAGNLRTFGEGEYGGDQVVIGVGLARSLGIGVGDQITLLSANGESGPFGSQPNRKAYTVAAIFSIGLSEYDQAFVFMPLTQAQLFLGRGDRVDTIEIMVRDPDRVGDQLSAIRRAAGSGAGVLDWRDRNRSFFEALQVERVAMRLILMVVVLIAALNIISGLVMLVKNKGRDIAVLRTLGARRSSVLRVFVLTGAIIGVSGTIFGVVLGALFCIYISPIQGFVEQVTGVQVFNSDTYYLSRLPARIDWSEVVIVTLWSLAVSVLCTLPPAIRASRLDPVEALRYE